MNNPPYDIGYKRPPVASRWRAGESGNPSGRRRRVGPSFAEEASDVMSRPQHVIVAGREVKTEFGTAVFRRLTAKAIHGDMGAMAQVVTFIGRLEATLSERDKQATNNQGAARRLFDMVTDSPEEAEAGYQQYLDALPKKKPRRSDA